MIRLTAIHDEDGMTVVLSNGKQSVSLESIVEWKEPRVDQVLFDAWMIRAQRGDRGYKIL